MEIGAHIEAVHERGVVLAAAAGAAGLDAPVPTCPDWVVRDLVAHQGGVHRWATWHLTSGQDRPATAEESAPLFATPPDEALLDWFIDGHRALVDALREADPALSCWTFLPAPSPRAFWARRQAHETTIHSLDAEAAAGRSSAPPADLAVDGIDELFFGFLARKRGRLVADPAVTFAVCASDTGDAWSIRIEPDRRASTRDAAGDADCTITAGATTLYRFLWNRAGRDEVAVQGDAGVLDLWHDRATITWS